MEIFVFTWDIERFQSKLIFLLGMQEYWNLRYGNLCFHLRYLLERKQQIGPGILTNRPPWSNFQAEIPLLNLLLYQTREGRLTALTFQVFFSQTQKGIVDDGFSYLPGVVF